MTLTASEAVDLLAMVIGATEDAERQAELNQAVGIDPEYWREAANRYRALEQKLLSAPCDPT